MTIRSVPTLFVECTHSHSTDRNTGIQRVVRNILRNLPENAGRLQVVPLVFDGGTARFIEADNRAAVVPAAPSAVGFARRAWRLGIKALATLFPAARRFLYDRDGLAGLIRRPAPANSDLDRFEAAADSILLLLDSSWDLPLWPEVRRFKARGGTVIGVVYDLIPLSHPESAVGDLPTLFRRWLLAQAEISDGFLCISHATATALGDFMAAAGEHPPIASFRLGSELDLGPRAGEVPAGFRALFTTGHPVFLIVGSIEPRKRHGFVLDAFELYWRAGGTGALVVIGREDWRSDAVLERMAGHPERDRRLFLVRDADDATLDHAYRHATALVMASEAEGFGLPIVEAFQRGLPVLCTDIPVFHEVAETGAAFFPTDAPQALADLLHAPPTGRTPGRWQDWRASTREMFSALEKIRHGK